MIKFCGLFNIYEQRFVTVSGQPTSPYHTNTILVAPQSAMAQQSVVTTSHLLSDYALFHMAQSSSSFIHSTVAM